MLAYNIRHGEGLDGRFDLERLARVVTAMDPDLVALQEVDQNAARSGSLDQAALLGQLTGLTPVFGAFMDFDGGSYGMAVLARWEIVRSFVAPLPDACASCPCNPFPCPEKRSSVVTVVRSPRTKRELLFAGVHLYQNEDERLAQAVSLADRLRSEAGPIIPAGDFNSERGSPVLEYLARDRSAVREHANRPCHADHAQPTSRRMATAVTTSMPSIRYPRGDTNRTPAVPATPSALPEALSPTRTKPALLALVFDGRLAVSPSHFMSVLRAIPSRRATDTAGSPAASSRVANSRPRAIISAS